MEKQRIDSFFNDKIKSNKLWLKPPQKFSNNSKILAKSQFFKKGKRLGLSTSRIYFLTKDYLYYTKVRF